VVGFAGCGLIFKDDEEGDLQAVICGIRHRSHVNTKYKLKKFYVFLLRVWKVTKLVISLVDS
jgi:hypothetical protein